MPHRRQCLERSRAMTTTPDEPWINTIIQGDARTYLCELPDQAVHCIVTSPPYYLQRDYSTPYQIGNESSPEEYIQDLATVFRECYRVLRDDGTCWLNMGDKYQDGKLLGMPWRVAL